MYSKSMRAIQWEIPTKHIISHCPINYKTPLKACMHFITPPSLMNRFTSEE